ncbi:hypothetical protein A3F55_00145 [Candidatus Adlerbacteria bacterium RIFCSPHIGHO2_12_FULL_53_18]|uniref:Uncharacterized protein n=1 Tax=Candidatus Adlerbacteria bacterium RIFCSPHIGHO2_12_FULL_53_18 TaxID=1797242 RepID=A0A1F4XT58_9BACT|nr:MAG: hypothetical protein A3F55_00145 [Candidatus Adlerbacteria bacterium RIFCSPHIGHO2_12_FULL_53_18]
MSTADVVNLAKRREEVEENYIQHIRNAGLEVEGLAIYHATIIAQGMSGFSLLNEEQKLAKIEEIKDRILEQAWWP